MKLLASTCDECVTCKHMKRGTCPGLIDWRRQDCPDWFTSRLVPEWYGEVLVRAAPGRPL